MSDSELADSVDSAGGKVAIGFKEPWADAGVDRTGRVRTSETSRSAGVALLAAHGVEVEFAASLIPAVTATISPGQVARLRAHPLIDYIEPVVPGRFQSQEIPWNVQQVRAPESWSLSTGGGVKVAILDTGRPDAHPDFPSVPLTLVDCSGSGHFTDLNGHGTAVAGVVGAANNDENLVGVSYGVHLVVIKVHIPDWNTIVCGLQWAYYTGASVVNLSIQGQPHAGTIDLINSHYYWHGTVLVAAAGNTSGGAVTFPANLPEVIAVTAVDNQNQRWSGAAIGSQIELAAPGVAVHTLFPSYATPSPGIQGCTALPNVYEALCTGTSFATPHVTAAAAILKAYNPNWSNTSIRDRLRLSATPLGSQNQYGHGLVDIRGALDLLWPLPPPSGYSATISGPTEITPTGTCQWTAGASGGGSTGPYSFEWRRDGQLVSIADFYEGGMDGATSFGLTVNVTSAEGWLATSSTTVTNTGFGECFLMF